MTLPAQKCICSGIHIRTTVYKTQNATPDCANRRQSRRCIATICYTHRENDDVDGRASVTKDEERVLRGGWTVMRLCRYEGCQDFVSKWEELVFNALGVTVHQRRHLFSTPNYYYYCCCARLKASFPGQHAWAGTRKVKPSVDLNEARDGVGFGMQWHQLDHIQTICTSLQTDNHTNTSPLDFYRPGALPDAQPTVSKHWRHRAVSSVSRNNG